MVPFRNAVPSAKLRLRNISLRINHVHAISQRRQRSSAGQDQRTPYVTLRFQPDENGTLKSDKNLSLNPKTIAERSSLSGNNHGQLVFIKGGESEGLVPAGTTIHQARVKAGVIEILRSRKEVQSRHRQLKSKKLSLGLVPTMGALHEGHLSLVRHAAKENKEVWVSIFLNPTQFGPTEDLSTYPQTWNEDIEKLMNLNEELSSGGYIGRITAVFAPTVRTMYPGTQSVGVEPKSKSYVTVDEQLTGVLEGAARPTFFRGVATVVMKLFNIVRPDSAYFGQKDIQQLAVIKRMVSDFMLDVQIKPVPIERAEDTLALSSRNAYLGKRRRQVALVLNRALRAAEEVIKTGETRRGPVLEAALKVCQEEMEKQRVLPPTERVRFEVDYISLAGLHDLQEIEDAKDVKTAVLSGTIIMLPLEELQEGEELGLGDDVKPVRLLDNILWQNDQWRRI